MGSGEDPALVTDPNRWMLPTPTSALGALEEQDVGQPPELALGDADPFGFVDGKHEVFEGGGGRRGNVGDEAASRRERAAEAVRRW